MLVRLAANRRLETGALIGVVVAASIFRIWKLTELPGGLHFDEAIDLRQGLRILSGERFFYATEGWGREAFYYYLVAGMLRIVPDNELALRLTAVLVSLATIPIAYLLARRLAGTLAAWFTAAWLSVLYWVVFTSRFAVRDPLLPLLSGLAAVTFWWAWDTGHDRAAIRLLRFAGAGALLGLTLYTYQPSRFIPFIYLFFFGYLFFLHRKEFGLSWRGLTLFLVVAIVFALPLASFLLANPGIETGREWTVEPLSRLLNGDPSLVWSNLLSTAKMFTIAGDPLVTYNVPGRPVFVPEWTGLFLYAGVLLAIARWRKAEYAFLLIWLPISLLPTVFTVSAPNFNRTIAAQIPVAILSALPVAELGRRLWTSNVPSRVAIPIGFGLVALLLTARATWKDYFTRWPQAVPEDWTANYNVRVGAIADYLSQYAGEKAVLINSTKLEDIHPYILENVLDDRGIRIRWVDTGQSIGMPGGEDTALLVLASNRWIDSELSALIGSPSHAEHVEEHFAIYEVKAPQLDQNQAEQLPVRGVAVGIAVDRDVERNSNAVQLPVSFLDIVELTGIYSLPAKLSDTGQLTLFTTWRVLREGPLLSLASFAHLLDAEGNLVTQQDGLGYPPHTWAAGDVFVQLHRLEPGRELTSGRYWIQFGLYERGSGMRWSVKFGEGVLGDRLLFGPLTLER